MKRIVVLVVLVIILFNNSLGYCIQVTGRSQLTLTEIAQIHSGSRARDVWVDNDFVFILDCDLGLRIYDIRNHSSPEMIGSFRNEYTFAHGLYYSNELVFIADYTDKLEVVDVSDPYNPEMVGQYREIDTNVQVTGSTNIHISGNLALLSSQGEGLEIIDIEDPTNPVKIGSYFDGLSINAVHIVEELAIIREIGGNFKILDISDPTSPVEIYKSTGVRAGQNFCVMDNLLYVPDESYGLRIYDITDPTGAVKVGEKEIDGDCLKVAVERREGSVYAYVTAWESGLFVLNVTNPEIIEDIAQYNDGGQYFGLFIQDNVIFIAKGSSGLEILQIGENPETTSVTGNSLGFNSLFAISGLTFSYMFSKKALRKK